VTRWSVRKCTVESKSTALHQQASKESDGNKLALLYRIHGTPVSNLFLRHVIQNEISCASHLKANAGLRN